jgi:hypothetical protein
MTAGVEVYDSSGGLVVSYTDKITRLIDTFTVGADSSGSKTYPDLSSPILWAGAVTLGGSYTFTHKYWFVGNTIYWSLPYSSGFSSVTTGPTKFTVMASG